MPYFHSYCAWIIGQVISVRVAEVLLERFETLVKEVTPTSILSLDNQVLREIGLSMAKVETIKRMAQLFLDKEEEIEDLLVGPASSVEIVKYFTEIKGIGPWTVEMFLIFNCTRLDVFSYRDLVVRKGMQKIYALNEIPSIPEARKLGAGWGELATIGTLLSWAVMGE
jgi:DNA-3-methyladenine glycosylase II